jgi:hypothetical protein
VIPKNTAQIQPKNFSIGQEAEDDDTSSLSTGKDASNVPGMLKDLQQVLKKNN